ncbi:MAG TPA: hypothetical protein VFW71_10715 [Actinomycetota bacterium]|nr:hypothetical protein [Actinomycetota bacterium]
MNLRRLSCSFVAAGTLAASAFGFTALSFMGPLAGPAGAATSNVTVVINSPGANAAEQGTVPINVSASCSDLLCAMSSVSISITDGGGAVVGSDSWNAPANSTQASVTVPTYQWNSGASTKANGTYTINATGTEAKNLLGTPPGTAATQILVNNPPANPSGVKATLSGSTPVVSWNPNPEADITGYEVFRSGGSGSAAAFNTAAGVTSYQDTAAPAGTPVSYIVVAVRSSPVYSSGITSCGKAAPCSSPPTNLETAAVTVPAPSGPTLPNSVATVDPPKPVAAAKGVTGTSSLPQLQPVALTAPKPNQVTAPSLPTTVIQLPQPNVVQFAPLLPYSGKIPEQAVTTTVPAPVQAPPAQGSQSSISLPAIGKVTPVNAAKYIAAAAILIVLAVHLTRYARKLTRTA